VVQGPTPTPEPTKKPTPKPSVDGCSKQIKN
jgi:lysozyme